MEVSGPTRPSVSATSRDEFVHVARGFAAMFVCVAHVVQYVPRVPAPLIEARYLGAVGVHVFFAISGFVVPWSLVGRDYTWRRFPRFLARRLVRLDPPYLISVAAALVLVRAQSLSTVLLHFGYLAGIVGPRWMLPVYWTLGIEFQFYILIGLLFPLIDRTRIHGLARSIVGAVVLAALGRVLYRSAALVPPNIYSQVWVAYADWFLLGLALFAVRRGAHWTLPVVFGLLATTRSTDWLLVVGVVTVLGWGAVRAPHGGSRTWQALRGLGTISYSLYLTHLLLFIPVQNRLWPDDLHAPNFTAWQSVGLCLLETALAVIVALVFYRTIERRAVAWSRRIALAPGMSPTREVAMS